MSDDIGSVCAKWWARLTAVNSGQMRADLARLRRTASPAEALGIAAVHELNHRLAAIGHDLKRRPETLVLIALALAEVKTSTPSHAAGRMRHKRLSDIRFSTLIRATDPAALITPLRRALRVVGQEASVPALARDLYWWSDATRARWCFDYYGAQDAAPNPEETEA